MQSTSFAVASLRRPPDAPFVEHVPSQDRSAVWAARAVTLARIPVGVAGVVAVMLGWQMAAILIFALFAIIDVFDGVAARQAGCDTAARRAGDVTLDRLFIHLAALTCCLTFETGWLAWLLLLSRDLAQAVYAARFTVRTRTVVIGAHWHMSYGLAMLAWGSFFIASERPSFIVTLLAGLVSIATFIDYTRKCMRLEASEALRAAA